LQNTKSLIPDFPSLLQIRTDRGHGGNPGRLRGEISRGLLEFTFKAEYAYDHGMPQWMARIDHLLSPFHPERLFLGRHKFYHFRIWYRDALSKYVQEMLLDSALSPGLIWSSAVSKASCAGTSKGTGTTPPRFIKS
jgi:hypothetical protein